MRAGCPVGELFSLLGQPHVLEILHAFRGQNGRPMRFGDLQTRLGLAPRTLSDRLKLLVQSGFLVRRAYREVPPRVEYEPLPKTAELGELFALLEQWARRNNLTPVAHVSVVGRVPAT